MRAVLAGIVTSLVVTYSVPTVSVAAPGGWIAFGDIHDGDLYAIRADGTGLRRLLTQPGGQSHPDWSPDYTQIAYQSGSTMWVYNWLTGATTKIYDVQDHGQYDYNYLSWSPDGSKILITEFSVYNNPHITVINADGTGRQVVPVEPGWVCDAHWGPGGTAFVYGRRNDYNGTNSTDFWIYDFTATGDIMNGVNHRLTQGGTYPKGWVDWGPGSDVIAMYGGTIAVIDPGVSPTWGDPANPQITYLGPGSQTPSWSPDGQYITFTDPAYEIQVMDATGQNRYWVATGESPDWGNPPEMVPAPGAIMLVGLGAGLLGWIRRGRL